MDTSYNQEQLAFRESLRRFLADNAGLSYTRERWHEAVAQTPAVWQQLVELGISGLLAPEDVGGLAGSMADIGIVMEELGRSVHPSVCWASAVGATSALALFAPDNASASEVLTDLVSGRKIATLAIEEHACSFTHWRNPTLRSDNGKLVGEKIQVPDALSAHHFIVSADDGLYLVAADADGLEITSTESFDGSRRVASVSFNLVYGERLGDVETLAPVIDRMLVALCADGLGAAQMALELATDYARERVQFDQPIGAFQAIQHLCADMFQRLEMGRAGLHYALWAVDHAEPTEGHRAAVMVKAFMSDYFAQIGADAIQIFGGAGFTWEYDIQLYYKRLLSLAQTYGDAQIWLEELAQMVIDD